jgi:WD40 repeat protein
VATQTLAPSALRSCQALLTSPTEGSGFTRTGDFVFSNPASDERTVSSLVVEAYSRILSSAGNGLVSATDLQRMLDTGDFFNLELRGSSEKAQIRSALNDLHRFIVERRLRNPSFELALKVVVRDRIKILSKENAKRRKTQVNVRNRSPGEPSELLWVKRFSGIDEITDITLSDDGLFLVYVTKNHQARFVDVRNAVDIDLGPSEVLSATISPDGSTVAVATEDLTRTFSVRKTTRKTFLSPLVEIENSVGRDKPIALSADGSRLVFWTYINYFWMYDTQTGELVWKFDFENAPSKVPTGMGFSHDGKKIAINFGCNGSVVFSEETRSITSHVSSTAVHFVHMAFSEDDKRLLVAGNVNGGYITTALVNPPFGDATETTESFLGISVSGDFDVRAAYRWHRLKVQSLLEGEMFNYEWTKSTDYITAVAVSKNGKLVAVGHKDGNLRILTLGSEEDLW